MRYSQLEWPWKLLAVVLFFATIAAVWWFMYNLTYVWLPDAVAGALGLVVLGFTIGINLGGYLWGGWYQGGDRRPAAGTNQRIDKRLDTF